jgi:hypothetical protein
MGVPVDAELAVGGSALSVDGSEDAAGSDRQPLHVKMKQQARTTARAGDAGRSERDAARFSDWECQNGSPIIDPSSCERLDERCAKAGAPGLVREIPRWRAAISGHEQLSR